MRVGDSAELGTLRVGDSVVRGIARGSNSDLGLPDWSSLEFFDRAGVLNSGAKTKIDSFVRYCKNTGIWNSLYCFPLVSTQNPNLEPLGGLVNTATSTADRLTILGAGVVESVNGLSFLSPASSRLAAFNTNGLVGGNQFTMLVVARTASVSVGTTSIIFTSTNNSWAIGQPATNATTASTFRNSNISLSRSSFVNSTDHVLLTFSQSDSGTVIFSSNGNALTGGGSAPTALGSTFCLGSFGSNVVTTSNAFEGNVSFVGVLNNYPMTELSERQGFYNELKTNLLNGLLA